MEKIDFKALLDQLRSIDLSSIDADMARDFLEEHKELTLSVILIVGSIFGSFYLYGKQMDEVKQIERKVVQIQEKAEPSKDLKAIDKTVAEYISHFPASLTDQELIEKITTLADKHGIQIDSYSSTSVDDKGFYTALSLLLSGVASDYLSLAQFVYDVEYAEYALRINTFSAQPIMEKKGSVKEDAPLKIAIEIAVLQLKKNDDKNVKN